MGVLLAVVKELWTFATTELFLSSPKVIPNVKYLPVPVKLEHVSSDLVDTRLVERTVPKSPASTQGLLASSTQIGNLIWCIAVEKAYVHHEPVVAFDNVIMTIAYGTTVTIGKRSGRFVQVPFPGVNGWIQADTIKPLEQVLPQLQRGKMYDVYNVETEKLRLCIGDSFSGTISCSLLSSVEYVTYRLWQHGLVLPWLATYGRVPGTWQRKLRGVRGVRIDVMPHTGSVMEYILDDVGYVAYVETVAPDLRIKVTGIGLTNEGQFTEQVFERDVWRELRPVFIVSV